MILPLSNPNSLSEAEPANLYQWTRGKALVATGSPFERVEYEGSYYRIAQSNNALAFPGIGLGSIAVRAKHVSDEMLWAATEALALASPVNQDLMAPLLPRIAESRMISRKVAEAVAKQALAEGLAQVPKDANIDQLLNGMMWEPKYYPYRKIK